jgi:hypothetical protein
MATTFPTFPSLDFSKLDLSKLDLSKLDLSKFDFSKIDFGKLDLSKRTASFANPQTEQLATKVAAILRDAAYVVIGFGVLTVQQAQVRRRELVDTLSDNAAVQQMGVTRTQIEEFVTSLEGRVSKLDERFDALETRLDTAVESAVGRLPEQAGALVSQAHEIAKAARKQVRGLIRNAA